ncbi:NUDIX domain-containing protein [Methylobacterium nodulans]|uniref:GDP-mannose pyrophosphatase n=1 Tax=Methylobacterium nodulans (strain LMG 21967 / CNCM I-2342 / ORS 2060) TaxID=460265 RepID=B8ILQ4_METNO|nr:NUDIX hydrolase [Methylobacterium nodulans]ACL62029.1 NUDIX hydrolase [Methylobacterium nodulans ORS 2060]
MTRPDAPRRSPLATRPRIVGTRTLYEGWGRYLLAEVRLADGGTITREVEDHGRAVAVLPYDPERRTALLVRQFRAPPCLVDGAENLLEAPAGCLDESDPAACARREAFEEVGVRLSTLEPVAQAFAMPGISTELMDLYLAPYGSADRDGEGGGLATEHENIVVVEMPLAELAAMAEQGGLRDLKTLVLVQTLRLRRPDLFAGPA